MKKKAEYSEFSYFRFVFQASGFQKKAAPINRAATFTLLLQAKIDRWLNNHSRYINNNNLLYKVAVILIFAFYFTLNKQFPLFNKSAAAPGVVSGSYLLYISIWNEIFGICFFLLAIN